MLGDIQLTSNAAIVVLSTGAEGLGKSIVLELDNDRYTFVIYIVIGMVQSSLTFKHFVKKKKMDPSKMIFLSLFGAAF